MVSPRVILVTGANRGIGYGIVRRAANEYGKSFAYSQSSQAPLKIYLTSRDEQKGRDAIEAIKAELKDDVLANTTIEYHQLDLSDAKSKEAIVAHLKKNDGGLDVLINNAGIALNGFDVDVVKKTFALNYWDVTDFNERILPILKPGGRIVILASMAGSLNGYSTEITKQFRDVSSKKEADEMAKAFTAAAEENIDTLREKGWKQGAAYSVSKACVIAYTRGRANDLRKDGVDDRFINCCCPGYVNTDMTKGKGVKTIDQGSMTPVMLALQDIKGRSGGYFSDEKEQKW